jgi:hypothetical protein
MTLNPHLVEIATLIGIKSDAIDILPTDEHLMGPILARLAELRQESAISNMHHLADRIEMGAHGIAHALRYFADKMAMDPQNREMATVCRATIPLALKSCADVIVHALREVGAEYFLEPFGKPKPCETEKSEN